MNFRRIERRFLLLPALACASVFAAACSPPDTGQTAPPTADPAASAPADTQAAASAPADTQAAASAPADTQAAASAPADTPASSSDADPARDPWSEDSDAFDATSIMERGKRYEITSVLPKDAIPAIFDPDFLPSDSSNLQYRDTDLVIGVSIDGDHRAYHVPYLSAREIVNDVVGGKPIAVTW